MGSVEVLTVGRKTMVGQDGQHIHTWREGALHGPSRASVSCFKMQSETVDFSDLYDLGLPLQMEPLSVCFQMEKLCPRYSQALLRVSMG